MTDSRTSIRRASAKALPLDLDFSSIFVGREQETLKLSRALSDMTTERTDGVPKPAQLVVVKGKSGTGKSRLCLTLRQEVEAISAGYSYFCAGKLDQNRSSRPFPAIVQALSELCEKIIASENDQVAMRLQDSLGKDQAAVLNKVIPNFSRFYGARDSYSTDLLFQKEYGFGRLKSALHHLLRAVCTSSQVVVFFIDDVQWTDQATLDLIESSLVIDGMLVVVAFRDNEVDQRHALTLKLEAIRKSREIIEIYVQDLCNDDLNKLVASATNLKEDETRSLTDAVFRKTRGNPFFAIQFLRKLQDERLLYLSMTTLKAEWDRQQIMAEMSLSENVVDFMAAKIDRLPTLARDSLMIAACLGLNFDSNLVASVVCETVEFVSEGKGGSQAKEEKQTCNDSVDSNLVAPMDSETQEFIDEPVNEGPIEVNEPTKEGAVRDALLVASKEGLIDGRRGSAMFHFSHDRIQQAAYSLAAKGIERDTLHLRIGKMLKRRKDRNVDWQDWMLLVAADQLNLGSALIKNEADRLDLASLNLEAAHYVMLRSAFLPAVKYLKSGLSLVSEGAKWTKHYDLTLQLCTALVDMAYCSGDFVTCRKVANEVLCHAQTLAEKLPVQFILVRTQSDDGDIVKAIEYGFSVLRQLGQRYPKKPAKLRILMDLMSLKRRLKDCSDEDLLSLPPMADPIKLAAIELFSHLGFSCWQAGRTDWMASLTLGAMILTVNHGLSRYSSTVFAGYGLILGAMGKYEEAYRFGNLAMNAMERKGTPAYEGDQRVLTMVPTFLKHLKHPVHEVTDQLLKSYKNHMERGDLQFAAIAGVGYGRYYIFSGLTLAPVRDDLGAFIDQLSHYGQSATLCFGRIFHQYVLNLMGASDDPLTLTGKAMDQNVVEKEVTLTNNGYGIFSLWLVRLMLGYIFRDLSLAGEMAEQI